MTAFSYAPLSQQSSSSSLVPPLQRHDLERHRQDEEKPYKMTVPQKQLTGLLIFVWLVCLWVALKVMEISRHGPHNLLPSTNALLNTKDLYSTLTLPLLQMANRTQLITQRCGTTSLAPHLLSFLDNDVRDMAAATLQKGEKSEGETVAAAAAVLEQGGLGRKYLLAVLVEDDEDLLPDLLTRLLETLAILGPDHCHISIVDHASTDGSRAMLTVLAQFLDQYNRGQNMPSPTRTPRRGETVAGQRLQEQTLDRKHYIRYVITTLAERDSSPDSRARLQNLVLSPLDVAQSKDTALEAGVASVETDKERTTVNLQLDRQPFDQILLLKPVAVCAEDLLELVYQSQLQNAEVTCGMDLKFEMSEPGPKKSKSVAVYDSSATRDILGTSLTFEKYNDAPEMADPETLARFQKRQPLQTESCWSSAVLLRASIFSPVSSIPESTPLQFRTLTTKTCGLDTNTVFCQDLWLKKKKVDIDQSGDDILNSTGSSSFAKIVLVPTIPLVSTAKDYAQLAFFDAWGLWPQSEQAYRNQREAKWAEASHRTVYGYKPSTSSYGYLARVEEEKVDRDREGHTVGHPELRVSQESVPFLKARLEGIRALFGVQDIENADQVKRNKDLIPGWRASSTFPSFAGTRVC